MTVVRVLHLYAGNLYGGIERVLATFARERHLCPTMGPHFGLCFRVRLWDELVAAGVPVYDLGPVRFSRPWTLWRARRRLSRLLRQEPFDAVVTHATWPHAVFARVVRAAGLLLTLAVHDYLPGTGWFDRTAMRWPPDRLIANSRFTLARAAELFPGVPGEVVYPPVPPPPPLNRGEVGAAVRAELDTPADAVVILTLTRLEPLKGHRVLIDALAGLRDVPGWVSWVAGGVQRPADADYLEEIRGRAVAAGIADRVRFIGHRSDPHRVMAAADVYCQPNTGPEGFGLTFVEALYAGLPVVTTGIGGAVEIVTPECGVLCPPGDAAAVARALAGLAADPERRHSLGAAGPPRAAEVCDPVSHLSRLADVFAAAV